MSKLYTVQSGDTLSEIAEDYSGVSYQDIYNANQDILDSPNEIYPGQQLDIPSSSQDTAGTASQDTVETASDYDSELSSIGIDWDEDGYADEIHEDYNGDGMIDSSYEVTYDGLDDSGDFDSVTIDSIS